MACNGGMRTLAAITTAVAVSFAVLAGCGDDPGDAAPTTSSTTPSTSATSTVPTSPTTSTVPTSPTGTKPGPTGTGPPPRPEVTLIGQVKEGVEAGCLLLVAEDSEYLLLGGDRDVLQVGAQVSVTGEIRPNEVTTCQQGIPFAVAEARRN